MVFTIQIALNTGYHTVARIRAGSIVSEEAMARSRGVIQSSSRSEADLHLSRLASSVSLRASADAEQQLSCIVQQQLPLTVNRLQNKVLQ